MTEVTDKVDQAIARFERVTRQLDKRDGPARQAARRDRQRLNAGVGKTVMRVVIAVGLIWLATIILGLVQPIGMFGFLGALLVTIAVAAFLVTRAGRGAVSGPAPSPGLPHRPLGARGGWCRWRGSLHTPWPVKPTS